ncbi:MAG: carbon storage regulator CsrA [Acidimicrobiia bacterium]|nr:carbon storage regulator CsrA [Acidimicrobiia bacterium]MDH5519071.1 carbon storage regulator CsrA [Acidimicrobiia bacterium]
MLVLSRRQGQAIVIGDNVVVRVVELKGDQVRLGIDAPRSVIVHREEIAEEIAAENRAARQAESVNLADLPLPMPRKKTDETVTGSPGGG